MKILSAVRADGFVDAVTVEKAMIEDGDERLFLLDETVIQVNPHHQPAGPS